MLPTLLLVLAAPAPYSAELATICAVGKEGTGNEAAAKAWATLVAGGADALLPTLAAFDGAQPAAQNWLRTAVDAIVEAEKKAGRKVDTKTLITFTCDRQRHPTARRIAFEMLKAQDPTEAENILVSFTDDPSLELRRDAIAKNLEHLKDAVSLRKLFAAARDKDQVEAIAKSLKELNAEPSITQHYGYVTQWHAVGPFENKDEKGFGVAYPPEKVIDLGQTFDDDKVKWTPLQSAATYGTVDLNKGLGKHKNAVAYATATIVADADTKCELRVASQNAVKFFVNGTEVFARDEYHHGTSMDQHAAKIELKKGANTLVLKVCQNDMPYPWAQAWGFAARLCDATGGAVSVKQQWDGKLIETGALPPAPLKKETP